MWSLVILIFYSFFYRLHPRITHTLPFRATTHGGMDKDISHELLLISIINIVTICNVAILGSQKNVPAIVKVCHACI